MGSAISSQVFLHPPVSYSKNLKYLIMIDGRLPAVFMRVDNPENSPSEKCPLTILFSHGNAEDLGSVSPWLKIIRDRCGVNILAYEYQGYGLYEGSCSEEQCYRDINAAYRYLVDVGKIPTSRIVLFGRSLGTGPTIDLASELYKSLSQPQSSFIAGLTCSSASAVAEVAPPPSPANPPVAGLILQSPLTSVINVVSSALARGCPWLDMFQSYKKIGKVQAPVLILHGTMDEVVPHDHGMELSKLCPNLYEMVSIQGAGHNDIEERYTSLYFTSIKNFLIQLDSGNTKK